MCGRSRAGTTAPTATLHPREGGQLGLACAGWAQHCCGLRLLVFLVTVPLWLLHLRLVKLLLRQHGLVTEIGCELPSV